MSGGRARHGSPQGAEDSMLSSRSLEAFSRKVTATANHLIGPLGEGGVSQHYQNALGDLHRELGHPLRQRQLFTLAQASPRELFRSKLSVSEIQHRALTYIPDELLANVPQTSSQFSLYQGFQATLPEPEKHDRGRRRKHSRASKGQKLLEDADADKETPSVSKLRNEKNSLAHRLEMFTIRKNMCSTEIREIDNKIANLSTMRKIVLDRLADLEQEEAQMEHELQEIDTKIEDLEEQIEDDAALAGQKTPTKISEPEYVELELESPDDAAMEASFMSESIYQKLPSPKAKRPKPGRRKNTFTLHEHLQSGSKIRELQAHNDKISALDFDAPFGTMVTAALDDTVRVWDLNAGRCMGMLEGHLSSVRCLQVEDNIVATGSMDASIRLWDLSQADYTPQFDNRINKTTADYDDFDDDDDLINATLPPPSSNMSDCPMFNLTAHVAEVTALHFHNNTLISGSADKTLRQWDLEKGRCVQTLDVLWAAAQASSSMTASMSNANIVAEPEPAAPWRQTGRVPDASADFVGALQCFDAALACGTADGMVRLWDLRSGQVHRSLVGHTGPVTCLQFDDVHLVTGSLDRSIRIWDLRTGTIYDAFAFPNPITSMMFDARRIVAAAGEDVVKVYDKTDGRHWDCGAGTSAPGVAGAMEGGDGLVGGDGVGGSGGGDANVGGIGAIEGLLAATVEKVRIKDGYLVEGRRDGVVGVWSC